MMDRVFTLHSLCVVVLLVLCPPQVPLCPDLHGSCISNNSHNSELLNSKLLLSGWYYHLEFLLKKYLIHFTSLPFIVASRNVSIFLLHTNNYILVFAKDVTIYKIIQNLCKINLCKFKLFGLGDYCIWVILCTFSIMFVYYYLYTLMCVVSLSPHCSVLAFGFSCSITKSITLFSSVWCLQFYWRECHTREVRDLSSTQPQTASMGNYLFHVWVNYFVVEIQDVWIGMLCWLVNRYVRLAESYCLSSGFRSPAVLGPLGPTNGSSALFQIIGSCLPVDIPEDFDVHQNCCENFKAFIILYL
jgi:hypothetical protein